MTEYLPVVQQRMDDLFRISDAKKPIHRGLGGQPHAQDTLELTNKLWRVWKTPEAVLIAAYAHDIDRTSEHYRVKKSPFRDFPNAYWRYKDAHQKKCREIFETMFNDLLPPELLADSGYMIERHEFGGDRDENNILETRLSAYGSQPYNLNRGAELLMVGDKLSYFLLILPGYFQERSLEEATETTQRKFDCLPPEYRLFVKTFQYQNPEINKMICSLQLDAQDKA